MSDLKKDTFQKGHLFSPLSANDLNETFGGGDFEDQIIFIFQSLEIKLNV